MKKHRKLIAIIMTLAFVMSLMPMAFAAQDYGATATKVIFDKTSTPVSVFGSTYTINPIKVTLDVKTTNGAAILGDDLTSSVYARINSDAVSLLVYEDYIQADVDNNDAHTELGVLTNAFKINSKNIGTYQLVDVAEQVKKNGAELSLTTDANGRIIFYALSRVAVDDVTISFYKGSGDNAQLIGSGKVAFTTSGTSVHGVSLDAVSATTAGAQIKLTSKVYDANNNGLAGKTVDFYRKTGTNGSYVKFASATTDEYGEAEYKFNETAAATYSYYAKVGTKESQKRTNVAVSAANPISITAVKDTAWGEIDKNYKVNFIAKDLFGNSVQSNGNITYKFTKVPSNGSISNNSTITNTGVNTTDKYVYAQFTPDTEGEYKVTAEITGTGIKATSTINTQEFGDVVGVKILLEKDKVALQTQNEVAGTNRFASGDSMKLRVYSVDANGFEKESDSYSTIRLATSNPSLVAVNDVVNRVYGPVNNATGSATITATHLATGLTATVVVPVVGITAGVDATVTIQDKVATVDLKFVDSNGNLTFEGNDKDYSLILPSGLTETSKNVIKANKGTGSFKVEAANYGSYNVTIITENGLAKTVTLDFVAPAPPKVVKGAAEVTMLIGAGNFVADGVVQSTDLAPFIQDGRTFVPVRVLAEAFDAVADWTPKAGPVEVVTLTRDDISITITIGSSAIVVVKDGVTSTVTSLVPAMIKDGRTVLPFRDIADAFGAEVTFGPENGPVEWVKFVQ